MGRLSEMREALRRRFGHRPDPEHDEQPWWDTDMPEPSWPNARVVEYVVTNRVFLLGLDDRPKPESPAPNAQTERT